MSRKRKSQPNLLSADVPAPLAWKLRQVARANRVPLSAVIRAALADFVREVE